MYCSFCRPTKLPQTDRVKDPKCPHVLLFENITVSPLTSTTMDKQVETFMPAWPPTGSLYLFISRMQQHLQFNSFTWEILSHSLMVEGNHCVITREESRSGLESLFPLSLTSFSSSLGSQAHFMIQQHLTAASNAETNQPKATSQPRPQSWLLPLQPTCSTHWTAPVRWALEKLLAPLRVSSYLKCIHENNLPVELWQH